MKFFNRYKFFDKIFIPIDYSAATPFANRMGKKKIKFRGLQ